MGECIKEGLLAQARMSRRLELLYRLVSSNIVGKNPYKYDKTFSIIVRIHQNDYACNTWKKNTSMTSFVVLLYD